MTETRVAIVSCYGRGHWLAVALQRAGLVVQLLDVSDSIGSWILEEAEGPFGIFQNDRVESSQWERLIEDDPPLATPAGWTLWLKSGPVEFRGAVTKHRLSQLGIGAELISVLQGRPSAGDLRKVSMQSFAQNWLGQLAEQLTASDYRPNAQALQMDLAEAYRPDWFGTFHSRQASRAGHLRSLDWCRRQGVKVWPKAQVVDLSLHNRRDLKGLEVKAEDSQVAQVIDFEQLIWCLTSEETQMLNAGVAKTLYPTGALEPEWLWTRFRVRIGAGDLRDNLPQHLVLLEDPDLPWTHENLLLLIHTGSADLFDVWMKLPNGQRFNRGYLTERADELLVLLGKRLVNTPVELANLPIGAEFTAAEVGPPRQPVFNAEQRRKFRPAEFRNLSLDSVEQRPALGWNSQFVTEQQIFRKIIAWWQALQEKEQAQKKASRKELGR